MSDTPAPAAFLALRTALADRYTLERELGAGGMATVYLVRDRKHDRQLALKVLRPELAAVIGAQRFLQEIRTTAHLQHPHILGLLDSGETEHQLWYVMPFVEGESLRDRMNRDRQLPVSEAVRLVTEVASALDYAHRHGVIHRDIKPENILLHDGRALVADFGIALAASRAGGTRMTETGMSLGTPQYMSPEQAMGEQEITPRSDVYALGVVLYELLSGEPPFTGPTAQAIVGKVLTGEPASLRAQRKTVPPHIEAAVRQALEKLPADRFASAADFAVALGNPAFTHAAVATDAPAVRRIHASARLPWVLFVAALGVIAFDQLRPRAAPARLPVQRFDMLLPQNAQWVGDIISVLALSPDGALLAYNGQDSSGHRRLFLRPMDQLDPIPVAGSENGQFPFFSPDGRWLGFRVGDRIVKSPVSGGTAETVCETSGGAMATWLENNTVVATDSAGLRQCDPAGRVTTLLAAEPGETLLLPHGLPEDRGVVLTIQRGSTNRLAVFDLRSKVLKSLDVRGSDPRYVETGHLVYAGSDGLVRAVRFDLERLTTSGPPLLVPDAVGVDFGVAMMGLSRGGTMVLAPRSTGQRALEVVDRTGRAERLSARIGELSDPRFSPDGRRIAFSLGTSIWLFDRGQGSLTPVSSDSSASRPVWSPDGLRLAYIRQTGRMTDLRLVKADGSTAPLSVPAPRDFEPWEVTFTPDGRSAVVRTVERSGSRDIWLVPLDSSRPPVPLLQNSANEVAPAVSPDGRWMAYVSNESGRAEVYVRDFPGMGGRVAVSLDGGTEPVWSPRGGELFYRSGATLIAAEVRGGSSFEILRRTPLFTNAAYEVDLTHRVYDVAPDGHHFVMVRQLGGAGHLTVTLHQFQHLGEGTSSGRSRR